jgi:hypothetical protein
MTAEQPCAPSAIALEGCARYVAFFEGLSPERLAHLDTVVTDDVHFVDPFNDVTGPDAMRRILSGMYTDTKDPRFRVTHRAFDGDVCFLRWEFSAGVKILGGHWEIAGMSELRFGADGRVREHIDHWDAAGQLYERLPGVGWLLRRLRRRIGHG